MDNLIKLLILPTLIGLTAGTAISQSPKLNSDIGSSLDALRQYREKTLADQPLIKSLRPSPSDIPTPTPIIKPSTQPAPTTQPTQTEEWGIAKQVDNDTYTIKVGSDERMATPQEVFNALNAYRSTNGVGALTWDDKLSQYSQGRAQHFKDISNVDSHAGFNNFLENENGFEQLGFRRLGENSYYGGPLTGTHLIEWVFAQSPGHNANQLDSAWSHVGVGVTETSVNLVFGGEKM